PVQAAGVLDVQKLRPHPQHQVLIGEHGLLLKRVVLLHHLGDVVAEHLVLVALLHVVFVGGCFRRSSARSWASRSRAWNQLFRSSGRAGRNLARRFRKRVRATDPSSCCSPLASTKLMEGLPTKSATNKLLGW